ncbi:hypothetical protein [Mesorhizobium sp. LNJC405B00]|nr:hypothetical protein [Mesorhizobium sp. LNJC405B00]
MFDKLASRLITILVVAVLLYALDGNTSKVGEIIRIALQLAA